MNKKIEQIIRIFSVDIALIMNFTSSISKSLETDILVIGCGSAGVMAALAASKGKHQVTIVERYGFPGGTSTQMLDTFYGFFTPSETPRKNCGRLT